MTKNDLAAALHAIRQRQQTTKYPDRERDHIDADNALLAYIGDATITETFESITKWYA